MSRDVTAGGLRQLELATNLPAMVYRCRIDVDRTVEFVSDGCVDITGYRPDELIGNRRVSYAQLIHPDDREPLWRNIRRARQEKRPFCHAYRLATAGKGERWVWEQGSEAISDEGQMPVIEGFVVDIADRMLALAFADNAAVAMENARLCSQAEQAAAAAERNRLARELHDAVTQTLFSASLIAEVLPRLWLRDPAEGHRRLEELRQATRGALAEIRTLLLELRPAALVEVDLGELLRQLAEAIAGRARIPVQCIVEGKRDLPSDVQVALYRIAQEALNNVAKHAEANHASVELRRCPDGAELRISDDGRGFDPWATSPEHLGLSIMRERAEGIGAKLAVKSEPGCGAQVVVHWTDGEEVDEPCPIQTASES